MYSCLKTRNLQTYLKMMVFTLTVTSFLYAVTGIFGYMTFGSDVNSDVLLSYPMPDYAVIVGVLLTAVKTYTVFPIAFFLGR